jgi:anti-sigma B factor antagonist
MASAERDARRAAAPQMAEVVHAEHDNVCTLRVSGEIDISNVGLLRDAAMALPNSAIGLVVDLSATTFLDSSTIGLLFELKQSLDRRSQPLRIVCPEGCVAERLLAISAVDRFVRSEPTLADAVAAIRAEAPPRPA